MNSKAAAKTIKLAGLVTRDDCVLASISQFGTRNGTEWTHTDSEESIVISKNHQRLSNERSIVSITTSPDKGVPSVETTAAEMFQVISAEDRYDTNNRVAYKEFSRQIGSAWRSVVYGGADLSDQSAPLEIDPYIILNEEQFIFSARFNDVVKEPNAARVSEKRYIKKGKDLYQAMVITSEYIYATVRDFDSYDMFRTIATGDKYHQGSQVWTVQEKRVFYLTTIGKIDFYGREILLF